MWEHYADDHRGVCLVFDRKRLSDALHNTLSSLRIPFYEGSVEYTTGGFSGSHARHVGLDDFPEDKSFEEAAAGYIERHHQDFFLLKTADWATEFEYRFAAIGPSRGEDYLFVNYGDSLAAVIVGHRFQSWQECSARAVCEHANAELRLLNWDMGRPLPRRGVSRPDA